MGFASLTYNTILILLLGIKSDGAISIFDLYIAVSPKWCKTGPELLQSVNRNCIQVFSVQLFFATAETFSL